MKLPPALDNLSKIKHAKIIGVLLALLVDLGLIIFVLFVPSRAGYYIMMIGTVAFTFLIPYIFGLRDGKKLAMVGIAIFFIIGAINGPLVANKMYSDAADHSFAMESAHDPATGDYLANGTITPLKGAVGQTYQFSVWYYSNQPTPAGKIFLVYQQHLFYELYYMNMNESTPADTNYSDGKEFVYTSDPTEFNEGIYLHQFELNFTSRSIYFPTLTSEQPFYGPLNGNSGSIALFYAGVGALSMFCNVGLMFIIVVLLYWWLGTSKESRGRWMDEAKERREPAVEKESEKDPVPSEKDPVPSEKEAAPAEVEEDEDNKEADKEEGDDFNCTSCGASVNYTANFCPNCGEMFDGIEDDEDPQEREASGETVGGEDEK